jgi:hypothetical protein
MNQHAGANGPVGHPYYAKPAESETDRKAREAEAQLFRVIQFNNFSVRVERANYVSKRVSLSGLDKARALRTLGRNGWTSL